MKKAVTKVLLCVLCALALAVLDIAAIRWQSANQLNLTTIPVAVRDIEPRTEISESDFELREIAGGYLMDNAYRNADEIIGKYTDIQGKIPKGSPFYKSMLFDAEDLPDHPVLQLEEGEAVYTASGDSTSFGALTEGLRVDIHFTLSSVNNISVTGCLIQHARILSIKDHQGVSISSPNSTGMPYFIETAVRREDLNLLTLAETCGQLRFFASSDSYQNEEAQLCSDSAAVVYLRQLMDNGNSTGNNKENP